MKWVGVALALTTLGLSDAFRLVHAGSARFWWSIGTVYVLLAALATYRLWDQGTLGERLTPRFGDLSLGTLVALVLVLGTWAGRFLLAPHGRAEHAWVSRIYLQIGDAESIQRSAVLTACVLVIPVLEELVWRGLVLAELSARFGPRLGWVLCAGAYTVPLVPTVFTLADPVAGANPLLVLCAFGCGLFFSFVTRMSGRLPPAMIAHMIFAYFGVIQFHLPGM